MSKLKFDLYEKRFAVFQATKDYFMAFDFYGQNNILKLRRETSERHFLFGRDVNAFFDEIERRQSAYEDVKNLELPRKDLVENSDIIRERHAAASKPILDLYDELINAFSKDLALRTLR